MYGVAIAGFRPGLIAGPLYMSEVDVIDELVLLTTDDERSRTTVERVTDISTTLNVKTKVVMLTDIFNFNEVQIKCAVLRAREGDPLWLNVSAGPGIAISAMVTAFKKSRLISYQEPEGMRPGRLFITSQSAWADFSSRQKDVLLLIKVVESFNSFKLIHSEFNRGLETKCSRPVSTATVSRLISLCLNMGILVTSGSGRGRKGKVYSLTSFGKDIASYSEFIDTH